MCGRGRVKKGGTDKKMALASTPKYLREISDRLTIKLVHGSPVQVCMVKYYKKLNRGVSVKLTTRSSIIRILTLLS